MNEREEIVARALEIAIGLTEADKTWLRKDSKNNIFIREPLMSTLETVIGIISAGSLIKTVELSQRSPCLVYSEPVG
jgi:hypothetical protein